MKKFYKDGKECMVDQDQEAAMIATGWSNDSKPEKPKEVEVEAEAAPEEKMEVAEEEVPAEEPVKAAPKRRAAPKKITRKASAKKE